jgi:RNA polymerase sigma-70 factor (ECF subfamily)
LTKTDQQNWNSFFTSQTEKSWDSLYRFALSLTRNEPEAEDLVQQTLIKALTGLSAFFKTNYQIESPQAAIELAHRIEPAILEHHLLNWMMKIAKNSFLDNINRSSRRLTHVPLDEWNESEAESVSQTSGSHAEQGRISSQSLAQMEDEFFNQALDDDWLEKFETLNAKQRSVLFLAAEDYSYKEISQLLDIPLGTVMSTLNRAISKLKKSAK